MVNTLSRRVITKMMMIVPVKSATIFLPRLVIRNIMTGQSISLVLVEFIPRRLTMLPPLRNQPTETRNPFGAREERGLVILGFSLGLPPRYLSTTAESMWRRRVSRTTLQPVELLLRKLRKCLMSQQLEEVLS